VEGNESIIYKDTKTQVRAGSSSPFTSVILSTSCIAFHKHLKHDDKLSTLTETKKYIHFLIILNTWIILQF